MISIILWGMNKGFDITDEGYYLLSYQKDFISDIDVRFHQNIIKLLFGWVDLNIINVRILRLVLTILSSYIFSFGFYKWSKFYFSFPKHITFPTFFLLILISALSSYGFGPQSLSYDSLSAFLFISSAGILFFMISAINYNFHTYFYVCSMIIGIILSVQTFVKISAAIPLIFSFFALIIFLKDIGFNNKIKLGISITIGLIVGYFLYSMLIQNIFIVIDNFMLAKSTFHSSIHGYGYIDFFKLVLKAFYQLVGLFLISFILASGHILLKKITKSKTVFITLGIFLIYFLFSSLILIYIFQGRNVFIIPAFMIIAYSLIFSFSNNKIVIAGINKNRLIVITFLLLIPFIGAFGTNTSLLAKAIFFLPFWFSLTLCLFNFNKATDIIFRNYIFYLITVFSVYFLINGYVFHPYRIAPLTSQKYSINNLTGQQILVDKRSELFLSEFKNLLIKNGFIEGDPIIACSTIPGLVYLFKGNSPGGLLWRTNWNLYFLNLNLQRIKGKKPIVIDRGGMITEVFVQKLNNSGVSFPGDYAKPEKLWNPYNNSNLLLYTPK